MRAGKPMNRGSRGEEKRSDQKEKELSSFTPMIKNLNIPKNKIKFYGFDNFHYLNWGVHHAFHYRGKYSTEKMFRKTLFKRDKSSLVLIGLTWVIQQDRNIYLINSRIFFPQIAFLYGEYYNALSTQYLYYYSYG